MRQKREDLLVLNADTHIGFTEFSFLDEEGGILRRRYVVLFLMAISIRIAARFGHSKQSTAAVLKKDQAIINSGSNGFYK